MINGITNPTTYASLTGNQPAALLDASYAALYAAANAAITYSTGFDDTGAANAVAISLPSPLTFALAKYVQVQAAIANNNTGPSTLNVNGTGPVAIVTQQGLPLTGGELKAGRVASFMYDGSSWQILASAPPGGTAVQAPARQTVLSGAVNSSGLPAFATIGAGLNVSLVATATPMYLAFAAGFGLSGANDYVGALSADSAAYWASLPANQLSFLSVERNTTTSALTAGQSILPPQYGYTYNQTAQGLLHFNGTNGSSTFLDDYGNTWAANGNAQLSTTTPKFGSASLLLDGTGDYASSTSITTFGNGSWTVEAFARTTALPGVGDLRVLFSNTVAGGFGFILALGNTAATITTRLYLSSNGTSHDIASNVLGAKTAWINATWYHFAVTFDAVAGKYFLYVDGLLDTTVVSTAKVGAFADARIGQSVAGSTDQWNGNVDEYRFSPCCRYPNGASFTPTVVEFTPEGDWFDLSAFVLRQATAASASAGTNPTFTTKQRVYVAEAVTGAAAVSSVIDYAFRGAYISPANVAPAASQNQSYSHNIGVIPGRIRVAMRNRTTNLGYTPGQEVTPITLYDGVSMRAVLVETDRNTGVVITNTALLGIINATSNVLATITAASWVWVVYAERGW